MRRAWSLGCALLWLAFAGVGLAAPADGPDVEVLSERMLFTPGPEGPFVLHMVHVVNVGPRDASRVRLAAPEGAVWGDVPEELAPEAGELVDGRPMAAGEQRQYVFTYELPWRRLPMPVRRPLLYPTAHLELWAEDSLLFRGVGLRAAGEEDVAGRRFTVYVTGDLAPHPQWQALLERTDGGAGAVSERERLGQRSDPAEIVRANPLPMLLLAAAGLLIVGAYWARRRAPRASSAGPDAPTESGPRDSGPAARPEAEEIARLKELIVQVDVAYQNGELDEDVYVERRRALREQLSRRLQSGRGDGSDAGGEAGGRSS